MPNLRRLLIVAILFGLGSQIPRLFALTDSEITNGYVNSSGVPLPPDAAPPEQQVLIQFSEDRPYNEWFRSVYKGAAGKYLIGEPLTRVNRDFELRGSAAEHWTVSEDDLIWTFYIRPGLQWSDGVQLTAHDYVFSLKRAADPNTAYDFGWYYQDIKNWTDVVSRKKPLGELGIRALDDLTLEISTRAPIPYLPLLLAYSWVSPEHIVKKYGDTWSAQAETSVSSGPFMVTKWIKGDRMVLEANPMYRGVDPPYLERIIYKLFNTTTPPQRLPAYEADEIYLAEIESQAELARLMSDGRLKDQVHTFPNFWTHYLFFDIQTPPFNDIRVRRAFAHAIDRQALAGSALKGYAVPAYSMLPPGFPGNAGDTLKEHQKYNPELARQLLAEAGYPDGKGYPKVAMWLRNEPAMHREAAEGLQALIKRELNIDVEIRNVENKIFMEGLNGHTITLGLVPYEFDYVDQSNMLGLWMSSGRHNWNHPDFDALMTQANAEVKNPYRRNGLYKQAERLLVEDVGGVFLWHKQKAQIWKPFLKGAALEPNIFGYRAWRGDQVTSSSHTLYISHDKKGH